jgi:hypothetical protein
MSEGSTKFILKNLAGHQVTFDQAIDGVLDQVLRNLPDVTFRQEEIRRWLEVDLLVAAGSGAHGWHSFFIIRPA